MPRQIIEDCRRDDGRVLLIHDPHDGSNKERWFVECQLRFDDETSARAFFASLAATTARVVPAHRGGNDVEQQTEEVRL